MKDFKVYQASGCLTNLVVDASDVRADYGEAHGSIANFYSPISSQIISLIADIVPIMGGQGDPSPTNIRPITGWTGCNIFRSGENTNYPTTYPISWQTEAGTVYGGTLTVNDDGSVDLESYMRMYTVNQLSWSYYSNGGYMRTSAINSLMGDWGYRQSKYYPRCSAYKTTILSNLENNCMTLSTANRIVVKDSRYTNADTFKSEQGNVQLLVPLATPVTYHLNSIAQITIFTGVNNIWADCGDVTVKYSIR